MKITRVRGGSIRRSCSKRASWVLFCTSWHLVSSQSLNELCTSSTVNCSFPAHSCNVVEQGTWIANYISLTQKLCRCDNISMAGSSCQTPCPGIINDEPCSGRGECVYSDATCSCDSGWQGRRCQTPCPRTFNAICAGKGQCIPDGLDGAKCECLPGFRGIGCIIECDGGAARPCSQRGVCEADGSCTCLGGWRGKECNVECPGSNLFPCNLHGKCTLDALCECDPLYRGQACEFECPDVLGVPCGGRGICNSSGICRCDHGYRGVDCMLECSGGMQNPCSGHGTCKADATCDCADGWAGQNCSFACPGGLLNPCSGHGQCVTSGEVPACECVEGDGAGVVVRYTSADCSEAVYNEARVQPSIAVTREMLFPTPQAWMAAMPPLTLFTAILAVVGGRLYLLWKAKKLQTIAQTNAEIADMTLRANRGASRER